jgi:hypothetical protein
VRCTPKSLLDGTGISLSDNREYGARIWGALMRHAMRAGRT